MQDKKIIIVGGGPIGLTAALQLAKQGKFVTILDSDKSKNNDGRVLAISYASYTFLNQLGVWRDSLATKINTVHISYEGLGVSKIKSSDVQLDNLGFTIKYSDICNLLYEQIKNYSNNIEILKGFAKEIKSYKDYATISYNNINDHQILGQLKADMLIIAEGGDIKFPDIEYNNFDYQQIAIIAQFKPQVPHKNIAYERFDKYGPMVLLPYNESYILVWSIQKDFALDIFNNNSLSEYLNNGFMKRFGEIKLSDDIYKFPLKLQVAKTRVLNKIVLVGNSAQTVHPISAQGMNLGLRDVQTLTNLLQYSDENTIFESLNDYNKMRNNDVKLITGFTHLLARFLKSKLLFRDHLKGLGIIGLSNFPLLQNQITNYLIFGI